MKRFFKLVLFRLAVLVAKAQGYEVLPRHSVEAVHAEVTDLRDYAGRSGQLRHRTKAGRRVYWGGARGERAISEGRVATLAALGVA